MFRIGSGLFNPSAIFLAASKKAIDLKIVHRGGWCKQRSASVKKQLATAFPKAEINLTEQVDKGSGKFDVFVGKKLVHSKHKDGHLDNYPEKMEKLVKTLKKSGY